MIDMSQSQARAVALEIYTDIADYIATHQEEYKAFLLEEEKGCVA